MPLDFLANHFQSFQLNSQKMRSALLSGFVTAAVALGGSTAALAAGNMGDKPAMSHEGSGERGGPGAPAEMGMMPFGRHLDHLLDEVKASDAQRQQIKQITEKARTDLMALHEQGKDLHERAMGVWTAAQIDPVEAEKVRQQMLVHHDLVSKRTMQAMLDVGHVLTPEQRAKAAQLMKERRARLGERMRSWMHRHMGGGNDDKTGMDH